MLDPGGDEMALFGLGGQGTEDRRIVALGAAGREDELIRAAARLWAMEARASLSRVPTWPPKECMGLPRDKATDITLGLFAGTSKLAVEAGQQIGRAHV